MGFHCPWGRPQGGGDVGAILHFSGRGSVLIIAEGVGVSDQGPEVWGEKYIPSGSFGGVEDEGCSPSEGDEEDSEMEESAGEEDVEQSDVIEEDLEDEGV